MYSFHFISERFAVIKTYEKCIELKIHSNSTSSLTISSYKGKTFNYGSE